MTARLADRVRVILAALAGVVAGYVLGLAVAAASLSAVRPARPCEVLRAASSTTAGGINGTDAAQ